MNRLPTDYDPHTAGIGYLTWDEWARFTRAVHNARTHVTWWRIAGHIKTSDSDELRTRSSDPTIPLPPTWLAAEEITNLLQEINHWPTLEDVAHHGPEFAVALTREVETAMHKWPLSDRPHKVQFLRCCTCQQATLKYYPPQPTDPGNPDSITVPARTPDTPEGFTAVADILDVTVKCTNCHTVEDSKNFAHDAALIQQENEIAKQRRLGDRGRRRRKSEPDNTDGVQVG